MGKESLSHRGRGGYLEALLQGCPDAILAIDAEGTITFANQEACKLTEREMNELVGQSISIVYVSPEAARETNRKLYLSGGLIHDHESMAKTKTGKLVPIRISASHLKDTAGEYTGAVGYFQTYRPWTHTETKAKAYTEHLEAKLQEWKDIGAPIYELFPGLSYLVIVGLLDSSRLSQLTKNLLTHMKVQKTAVIRIDLSAALVDDFASVARELLKMIRSVHLVGAESLLTGIDTDLALAMEPLLTDISLVKSFGSRDTAIEAALDIIGYEIHKRHQS
ncbi:MAG: anti-anti sigma factor protein [Dehalococcoidales bacterium]|nr:anti-anti sigma factor protein [Dehalococcoidales bacterium]